MVIKRVLKFLSSLSLAGLLYFVVFQQGCSDVTFDSLEPLSCDEFPAQSRCTVVRVEAPPEGFETPPTQETPPEASPETPSETPPETPPETPVRVNREPKPREYYYKYNYLISLGRVSFLFVLDNSSSMAPEHRNLAKQVSPFLKDIKNLRYNVGVTTMDISSSPENPVKGAPYQDGKLIPVGGRPWLSNTQLGEQPDDQVIADFRRALEREETKKCDSREQPRKTGSKWERLYQTLGEEIVCPSSDERGTYSMNLTVQNPSYSEFFNKDHVLFIPVSDEDIRSGEDFYTQYGNEQYQLEDLDLPETLVSNILQNFPRSRTFSFHPIIIAPRDKRCLKSQNKNIDKGYGSGRGYYGHLYAKLTRPHKLYYEYSNFLRGNTISICDRNYRSQLSQISLFAQESRVSLPCYDPVRVELKANGRRVDADYKIEGRTLYITSERKLSISSQVEVEVHCKSTESSQENFIGV